MFEVQLFFTLFVITAWATALGVGGFLVWLLVERDNAPFNPNRQDDNK